MARVLVIEDNPANMKLARLLLHHAGHTVLCAVDAETGLTLARTEQPDLILMDMQLPGMDGLTATTLLKQDPMTAAIPVIALTALAMKADQEKCRAARCDGYITKPLRYQELYAAINALLVPGGERTSPATATPALTTVRGLASGADHDTEVIPRDRRLILVAEDNPINQKLILRQLALLGFAANVAANGRLALDSWRSGHYALLLTDLQMPEMNGYALSAAIRAEEPGTRRMPILALTANARTSEYERCRAAGMDDCMSKPLQLAELKAALAIWLPSGTDGTPGPDTSGTGSVAALTLDVGVLQAAVGRDAGVIAGFLGEFRSTLGAHADAVIDACNSGDAPDADRHAHILKSSSRAVGANALGALCARIESAGRAGHLETLSALLPMFEQEVDAVQAVLIDHLAQHHERPHIS